MENITCIWYVCVSYYFVLFNLRLPLPPGAFSGLWENQETFQKLYFKKYPVRILKLIVQTFGSLAELNYSKFKLDSSQNDCVLF